MEKTNWVHLFNHRSLFLKTKKIGQSYRPLLILSTMFCMCIAMTACSQYSHYQEWENKEGNLSTREGDNLKILQSSPSYSMDSNPRYHQNQWIELSQSTANELMKMKGVSQAFVIITDLNAYVAASFDSTASGISGDNRTKKRNYPLMFGEQRNGLNKNNPNQNPNYPFNVLYSHYMGPNFEEISNVLKQRIGLKVRELNPQVVGVYITSDMDFLNQLHRYNQIAAQGKSIDPYLDEFNKKVTELFASSSNG